MIHIDEMEKELENLIKQRNDMVVGINQIDGAIHFAKLMIEKEKTTDTVEKS